MVSLLIGAALLAQVQASDLSKDPQLQQVINIHLKRALLPELTDYLKQHTDQHFAFDSTLKPLMVCVFADKQPLWKVMNGVANALDAKWTDLKSEWRLAPEKGETSKLSVYKNIEKQVLLDDIAERAKALADLVANRPWAQGDPSGLTAQDGPEQQTPKKWAEAVAGSRAYYAAGEMFLNTPLLQLNAAKTPGVDHKFDCPVDFRTWRDPQGYTLLPSENAKVAKSYMRFDPAQPELAGTQIAMRSLPWAGTIEAVDVKSPGRSALKPRYLLAHPKPVGNLAKPTAGKWLLDWESPLNDLNPVLDKTFATLALEPSPFIGKEYGIEDYLEALNKTTGITVISDGFRTPVIPDVALKSGGSVRDWLIHLRDSQNCFLRIDGDVVDVRHGGFWDLRDWEPDEELVRSMESIKAPDLDDYADFAMSLPIDTQSEFCPKIFECAEAPLTSFDSRPLRDSFLFLKSYGELDPVARKKLLLGATHELITSHFREQDSFQKNTITGIDQRGRPASITQYYPVRNISGEAWEPDCWETVAATNGIFYGAQPTGNEPMYMESFAFVDWYLQLSGRYPEETTTQQSFLGAVLDRHCHMLQMRATSFSAADLDDPSKKILYGGFTFYAGLNDKDGVIEKIDIPEPTHD